MKGIDALRHFYPLHVQRIAEAIYDQAVEDGRDADDRLHQFLYEWEMDYFILGAAFYWAATEEGHDYWARLGQSEERT